MRLCTAFCVYLLVTTAYKLFHSSDARTTEHQHELKVANGYLTEIVRNAELQDLDDYFVDYAHLKGLVFLDKEHPLQPSEQNLSNHFTVTEPMTVFPSPYPEELYEEALELQPLMAIVHLRVSRDYKFLSEAMKEVALADPHFIGKFMNIMETVKDNREQSGLTLILQRSDYLTHQENGVISLKQIEVTSGTNAGQGDNPFLVHQRVLEKIKYTKEGEMKEEIPEWFKELNVVPSESVKKQADALYQTWVQFHRVNNLERNKKKRNGVILLISASKRRAHSHFEQLIWAQYELEDIARNTANGGRPHLIQITIQECTKRLKLGKDKHLYLDGKRRVAVAMFLDGYLPEHFSDSADWKMRLEMEQSRAVVSPNVFVFFASSKTVQQVLSEKDKLEDLFPEIKEGKPEAEKIKKELKRLRATFIKMWKLGKEGEEEEKLVEQAIANSGKYVLKMNLEAGQGNFFGQKLAEKLRELKSHKERGAYILQMKVKPFAAVNAIVPIPSKEKPIPDQVGFVEVNSELSVFGSLLAVTNVDDQKQQLNHADKLTNGYENGTHGDENGTNGSPKAHANGHANGQANGHAHGIDGVQAGHDKFHGYSKMQGDQELLLNTIDGYMIRSKITTNDMCTQSKGMSGVDSLVLFPMKLFERKEAANTDVTAECSANGKVVNTDD